MCGIVGAYAFDAFAKKSDEKMRTDASIFITTQLLQATVDRGKEATGISLIWADGNYTGLKMGIPSPEFIGRFGEDETDFKGMLKLWREYPKLCKVFMGHCRKSSKGNSYDNKNNHPIQVGNMIFVHNGTLNNDDVIFDKLETKRSAAVDSEAIGHLLQSYTDGGKEPFTKEVMEETTRRLAGTYSVIAASGNNPYQVAQFRDGRPAECVLVRPLKMVFVASEKKYLQNILFEYNKHIQLFMAGSSMPSIKKDDVEFKTMIDDSYLIWDLTTPIEKDTKLDDLYDWGKTPLRVDKVWKGTTTTTTYNAYQGNNASKKTVVAGSSVSKGSQHPDSETTKTTTTTITGDSSPNSNGLVWSRSLNKYKTQAGIDQTKDFGAVEVNVDTGKIIHVGGEKDSSKTNQTGEGLGLGEVDKERVENLLCSAASINTVGVERATDVVEEVKKTGDSMDEKSDIVEIDMTTDDPEAIAAAKEYVTTGVIKFEKDEEVIDALDLTDTSILASLPVYAIANRIMKYVIRKGFVEGFMTAKATIEPLTPISVNISKEDNKVRKAERKIRVLKTIVNILGTAVEDGVDVSNVDDLIADSIKQSVGKRVNLSLGMSAAFSTGDFKNTPSLSKIKSALEEDK